MTNRSRYSTAPTYGMQKRPAPKTQAAPAGPYIPPAGPAPQGSFAQPAMPGYAQPGARAPQPAQYMPPPPTYSNQPAGFAQQPVYPPRQPGFKPQAMQPAMPMQQPMPYFPQQPYSPQPMPQEYAVRQKPRGGDNWLQILLLAVLPILFVLTLLVSAAALKIAFIGLGILALIAMWMQHAFVPSARATLTLVYGALMLVCIVSLIAGGTQKDAQTSARGNTAGNLGVQSNGSPTQTPDGMVQMGVNNMNQATPGPTPTPEPESGESSAAWQRLSQFFEFWNINNIPNMLSLVSPSWKAAQEKPDNELFKITANRTPLDKQFEKISNTETDSSRTITMTANIDKRNNRDPVKIRFQIVMLKVNNEWYVDPLSLASNDIVEDTANTEGTEGETTSATATPKPTATPAPKTKLYFNEKGGEFYHADSECSKVNAKFLPMTSFYYREVNTTKFKNLKPCPFCNAPQRP